MNNADLINLSLEQIAETLGDPTEPVFKLMFQRFPDLADFQGEDDDWQHYMIQEILTNFMEFGEKPDMATAIIREMTEHHRMIGVSLDIFKGMYQALLDTLTPVFSGPHKDAMVEVWQNTVSHIQHSIDSAV